MDPTQLAPITAALGTGITLMASNVLAIAVIVVPIALTIWAALLGLRYAKKFFGVITGTKG